MRTLTEASERLAVLEKNVAPNRIEAGAKPK